MRTHRWFGTLAVMVLAACGSYGAPDEVLFGEAVYSQGAPGFDFKTLRPPTYFLDPTVNIKNDTITTTHPVLYVAGRGGVFRSRDFNRTTGAATWTVFPDVANDGAVVDGGLLSTF